MLKIALASILGYHFLVGVMQEVALASQVYRIMHEMGERMRTILCYWSSAVLSWSSTKHSCLRFHYVDIWVRCPHAVNTSEWN